MDIFNVLSLFGGLSLFLFGMTIMGQALERRAGSELRTLLGKLTNNRWMGLLTGLGVTAIIQSSSATTVMVVGFVNSGLMTLSQSINVIMGANIGTTVTSWILSLSGISGDNIFMQLLKPTSFTPVLAVLGVIYYIFLNNDKKKDTGLILLGFATLMFGMDTMSTAVAGLSDVHGFQQLFLLFTNPILGVLAGAVLTAIIQSSSASVGILQALASTGQVTYGAAIPIIMGQNIGTCVTALLSSVGTNRSAKRAAFVHLMFNVIGTAICLVIFMAMKALFKPEILGDAASMVGIAIFHTMFNVLCVLFMLPMNKWLEKIVCKIVPDDKTIKEEKVVELDERLLGTPSIALERCHAIIGDMADDAIKAVRLAMGLIENYDPKIAEEVKALEDKTDNYEDILNTYLIKLSACQISAEDNQTAAEYLKIIGDYERIGDHGVNVLESAEEVEIKGIELSPSAKLEYRVLKDAISEILELARDAVVNNDLEIATTVEPLEEVIDDLKDQMRARHIDRLQQGDCSTAAGFVWSDLLTNLERTADHCSNIACALIDLDHRNLNRHEYIRSIRFDSEDFQERYKDYSSKYAI